MAPKPKRAPGGEDRSCATHRLERERRVDEEPEPAAPRLLDLAGSVLTPSDHQALAARLDLS